MRKKYVPPKLREEVFERARKCCEYCRANSGYSDSPFHVEHITPESKQGETTLENLALSCGGCNLRKSTRILGPDPLTGETVRLFNPRIDTWSEHFVWDDDYKTVGGITPEGRLTVSFLEMNREGLVNQRTILRKEGVHPPEMMDLPDGIDPAVEGIGDQDH